MIGMNSTFIEVHNLSKSFNEQKVLHHITFSAKKGEIIGLLGPNGSGKTTFIRLLNGVIEPNEGRILVNGFDPVKDGDSIRKLAGIVTESAGLYHELSALDNLLFFAKIYGVKDQKRLVELLEKFELLPHQNQLVGTFSTGMKKRLALAKALIHNPEILFLDEPTNGLDPEGIKMVMNYLKELNESQGTTIFICSHVLHQIESVCHSYAFLEKGKMIEQGTKKELEEKYLKQIHLDVETGLRLTGDTYQGYPAIRLDENRIRFILPAKDRISPLLQTLLKETWVHAAEISNRDLESLYFNIRRISHE